MDITNVSEIINVLEEFKPKYIVHCAAQRFPDKVDNDVDGTIKLNVEATKNLATLAGSYIIIFNIPTAPLYRHTF